MSCWHKRPYAVRVSKLLVVKNRESIPSAVGVLTKPPNATSNATTRILIAEDSESMRNALRMWFRLRKNWEICGEAQDAREVILQAEMLHPDLIVLDYKMQDTNGLQAAKALSKLLPETPLVMFTLYKTDELERAAEVIGIRCVIGKEEGMPTLLKAIESQLPIS